MRPRHAKERPRVRTRRCSLYTDLPRGALGVVNWYEVATHFVEDTDRDRIEADARDRVEIEPCDE